MPKRYFRKKNSLLLLKILFWVSLFIVFYSYLGYGLLLWVLNKFKKDRTVILNAPEDPPTVTLVTAVYNEEAIIEQKVANTFAINYPTDKLRIIFIADGSGDRTVELLRKQNGIHVLFEPERKGKVAAINRAMLQVNSEIVVFCDGNTFLNPDCILNIVRHYNDPEVGAVAGEKKIIDSSAEKNIAGAGEGLYWKYESFLKRMDSKFYTVVGAAGELFSLRTRLFEAVDKNILLDDFIISLNICKKGYRVVYEPEAYACEEPSMSLREEQKRKIRISAGGIQSVILLKDLLNIFKYGKLSFQYISHRVLRWIICPPLLPIILLLNIVIWHKTGEFVYQVILAGQLLFYTAAIIGWVFTYFNIKLKPLYIPYYFFFMNMAMYLGLIRYLKKTQSVLWEKAERKIK